MSGETLLEGEVGPELEQYVNALLDRIRELEARIRELEQGIEDEQQKERS